MSKPTRIKEAPQPRRQRGPDPLESPLLLSVPKAAGLLGVSGTYCWSLVHQGAIPSVRLGRRVLIARHEVEKIAGLEQSASSDPTPSITPDAARTPFPLASRRAVGQ